MNLIQKLGVCTLLTLSTGCAPLYKASPMPDIPPERCSYNSLDNCLRIGVEPFETASECVSILNHPVIDKGYLPFYLVLDNKCGEPISFDPRDTTLVDSKGIYWEQATPQEMANSFKRLPARGNVAMVTLAYIISPIGATAGIISVERSNKDMQKDYISKVLSEEEIDSQKRGFVIFRNESLTQLDFSRLQGAQLKIAVEKEQKKETFSFVIK